MKPKLRFPIRFKFLVTLLLVVTGVVSLITFTMAVRFQEDKKTYIHGLASVTALNAAQETRTQLEGYRGKLRLYLLLLLDEEMTDARKAEKIQTLFSDFPEFVSVSIYDHDDELESTVYDSRVLDEAGLTKEALLAYRARHPLPLEDIRAGGTYIANSTVTERLPTFTMALAQPSGDEGEAVVACAVLRLGGLLPIEARSTAFDILLLDAAGSLLAPAEPGRVVPDALRALIESAGGGTDEFSLGLTREYETETEPMIGGFAPAGFAGVTACVQIPQSAAYLASRDLLNSLVLLSLGLLLASAFVSLVWSRWLTRPIEYLSRATKAVGQGEFDIQVDVTSQDEIGDLAGSFNQMARELKSRDEDLAAAQVQLVQSEKMAAFGQLGAGIAHEVKNPLAGILGCAQLTRKLLEKDSPHTKNLELIERETKRCKTIIENLLKFARQEKAEQRITNLGEVLEDSAAIVAHQMSLNNVTLEKEFAPDLPSIMGNANQIQQVLMNLIINAQQAMEGEKGRIRLVSRMSDAGSIEIRVEDDGPGIKEEHQKKLFEPFFTTKIAGKGTGLGLSVSYGIVQDHHGQIRVESELGRGTTFVMTFPPYEEGGIAADRAPAVGGTEKAA